MITINKRKMDMKKYDNLLKEISHSSPDVCDNHLRYNDPVGIDVLTKLGYISQKDGITYKKISITTMGYKFYLDGGFKGEEERIKKQQEASKLDTKTKNGSLWLGCISVATLLIKFLRGCN